MLLCIFLNKLSVKVGVPSLVLFLLFGMAFNNPLLFSVHFQDFKIAEYVASICLVFIMFYGGFGTRWIVAKKMVRPAIWLSTIGVAGTAVLIALFCCVILRFRFGEGLLLGGIISSTDAASVFSIIRSKKLALKYNTSSLLELESGSNDPLAYMLTVIASGMLLGTMKAEAVVVMLLKQVALGALLGYAFYKVIFYVLKNFVLDESLDTVLIFSSLILLYSLSNVLSSNGYLAIYLFGICLGNSDLRNKINLVHFFDGITLLMQMMLFFLLGLLSTPALIFKWMPISFAVFIFLTFIARVVTVEAFMSLFKMERNQKMVISAAGFRGAASIVFAIMATNKIGSMLSLDVFHITFGVVLLSIIVQGSLFPSIIRMGNMVSRESDPLKTFSDYVQEKPIEFIRISISKEHDWRGQKVKQLGLNAQILIVLIIRGAEKIVPNGNTQLQENDEVVCIAKTFDEPIAMDLNEIVVDSDSVYLGMNLSDVPNFMLIILIIRNGDFIIPSAADRMELNDKVLYLHR